MAGNEAIRLAEEYAQAVVKEISPVAVILYGSHAKGTARPDSDLDIAVVVQDFRGDWLTGDYPNNCVNLLSGVK